MKTDSQSEKMTASNPDNPKMWLKVRLHVPEDLQDIAMSELVDAGFEGFEQDGNKVDAWILADDFSEGGREKLEQWVASQPDNVRILNEQVRQERNWNEEWEKSIRPQSIGRFYIHPTWAQENPPEEAISIIIDPKMAFGTGYHETTRLMLRMLPDIVRKGDRVLDMGAGTGVLAIAALKLGACHATGIDIDTWSYTNALENANLNGVGNHLDIRIGSTEQIRSDERFDLILANINRNILLDLGHELISSLCDGGHLLLSGFMSEDERAISEHPAYRTLRLTGTKTEGTWLAMALQRAHSL